MLENSIFLNKKQYNDAVEKISFLNKTKKAELWSKNSNEYFTRQTKTKGK
jgi:hypothetical protein